MGGSAFSQESLTTGERGKDAKLIALCQDLGMAVGSQLLAPLLPVSSGGDGDYCDRTCRINCSFLGAVSMSHF